MSEERLSATGEMGGITASAAEEKKKSLAHFSLEIVKTLLKSGYYSSEHPEAAAAIKKLFSEFKNFVLPEDELSYVLVSTIERQDILIEGGLEDSVAFSSIMAAGMGSG